MIEQEITQEIISVKADASSLKVVDNDTYLQASELLKSLKELEKRIKDYFKPLKEQAHKAWKAVCDRENAEIEKLQPSMRYLNTQLTQYNLEQERKRQEEEARLRREAEKVEEERRLQEALEAEKTGNIKEAEAILEEKTFIPSPIVEKTIPKVKGQTMTTIWRWRVIDVNIVPREYMQVNEIAVNQIVKALKSKVNIPGIEVYQEYTMRGVRT
jgi:septal ring factor EnvC (AmiA/AmiB activator)